jgi:WD40 repeat protein
VNTVAVSPDGRTAASADYRGVLRLTDLTHGTSRRVVVGRGGPINSAVFSADGRHLYTAGYDGHIRTWSADGEPLDDWAAHHSPIKSLAWSTHDGGTLVAGSSDGTLSAWRDRDERWRAEGDDMVLVNAVAVADGAGIAVSASRDLHVRRWDVGTGALVQRLPRVHHKSVKGIAISADGERIVSGSYDGTAVAWDHTADGGWAWRVLRLHGKPGVPAVAVTDGNLFTAGWDTTVGRWSLTGELVAQYHPVKG